METIRIDTIFGKENVGISRFLDFSQLLLFINGATRRNFTNQREEWIIVHPNFQILVFRSQIGSRLFLPCKLCLPFHKQ